MSIKATEVGKIFVYGTFFDLSTSGATYELKITGPDGEVIVDNSRITAPSVDFFAKIEQPDGSVKQITFPGNTYMQFSTVATDFPVSGTYEQYSICGKYEDPTPKLFFGDTVNFAVGKPC